MDTISYPDAQSIDDYTALQSYMQKNFGTPTQALLKGYIYPTHGFVVLTDNGFVLSNTGEIPGMEGHGAADDLDPMSPNLLFYAPTGAPSRVGFRRGSFTDLIPDFPYRLIGWGYLTDYVPGAPPELEGVTSEAWFVHESGWHLLNGGMKLTPPKGEDSCEKGRLVIEKAPKRSRPFNGIAWHQRAWDLHMWCGQDGVPVITYAEPFNQLPAKTLDLPAGAFFVPLFP